MVRGGKGLSVLTAQAATTFYDHGTRKHREASALAADDEAAAQYRGAADALRLALRFAQTAAHALRITRYQDQYGQVSRLAILDAVVIYEQAELTLFAALGGGWWNRDETDR